MCANVTLVGGCCAYVLIAAQSLSRFLVIVSVNIDVSEWKTLVTSSAIGTRSILLLDKPMTTSEPMVVRLTIDRAIAVPILKQFAVFAPCATQ